MSFNILEAVKGQITPDLISKASSFLDESDSGVAKAISGILPTVLGTMVSKTSNGTHGANEVFSMAKDTHSSGLLGSGLSSFFSNNNGLLNKGLNMVKGLFGEKANSIIDSIASFAGIKTSSAASLLSLSVPVVAGTLGKHADEKNMNAGGLASLLSSQKSSILNLIPGGLSSVVSMLGLGKIGDAVNSIGGSGRKSGPSAYNYTNDTSRKSGGGFKWLLPLLLLLLALGLLWWFLLGGKSGCNKSTSVTTSDTSVIAPVTEDTTGTTTTTVITPAAPESLLVNLPGGIELNAFKGGIEERLVGFLSTDWKGLGEDSLKKIWFDFDNLNFKTGSAEITPESQVQIDNLVAILKAFPNAKLKIGGYTDKTGNEATNKKISGQRANAVKAAIEKGGQGAQIISAEGYGSEFAQYPADAPETDRVKDRHVSVSVRG